MKLAGKYLIYELSPHLLYAGKGEIFHVLWIKHSQRPSYSDIFRRDPQNSIFPSTFVVNILCELVISLVILIFQTLVI